MLFTSSPVAHDSGRNAVKPAGFVVVSHRTCAAASAAPWSRESFGSKKADEKKKKTFLVTSETEGSVVQLVTVDHQAPTDRANS